MPPSGIQRDGRKAIKIRTPDEVLSSDGVAEVHRALELDAFPIGPLQIDSDRLLSELKLISINAHVGGGTFGITRDGSDGYKDGTTTHGPRPRFSCNRKGKDRCLCSLVYEWTTDGWMGVKYHSAHDRINEANPLGPRIQAHDLEQSTIAVSTSASGRAIPPELHELGRQLAAVCTPIQVHEGLQKEAKRRGLDHKTWAYQDVLSAFPVDASSKDFDAEGLIERLEENKREKGLDYKATVDGSRHLDKIFVEIDEARKEWALGEKENVLLFDPTHSTNRYGLKLCFFVTVGGTGQTVVLAFALIKHENIADISWAFRKFAEIFRIKPATLFTDGDTAISSGFQAVSQPGQVWHGTVHLLCIYHLSKNFFQKVHPLFSYDHRVWKRIFSAFWHLAKVSDHKFTEPAPIYEDEDGDELYDSTSQTFEMCWLKLMETIEKEGRGSTKKHVLDWLETHFNQRKEMWAYCYTWFHCSWGVHSTQRSESANSQLKRRRALANRSLLALCDQIQELNLDMRHRKEVDEVRLHLRQVGATLTAPELNGLVGKVTPYGLELIRAQTAQDRNYSFEETADNDVEGRTLYNVRYIREPTGDVTGGGVQIDQDGKIQDWRDDQDFGIGERTYQYMEHLTTVDTCSCQLLSSLRIPCRHIMCLRSQQAIRAKENMTPLLELIGVKWHLRKDSDVKSLVNQLRVAPPPGYPPQRAQASVVPREQRISHLVEELRCLAELGAEDMPSYRALLAEIPKIADRLAASRTHPSQIHNATGPATQSGQAERRTSRGDAQPQEDTARSKSRRKDPASFQTDVIDCGYTPVGQLDGTVTERTLIPGAMEGSVLVGEWIGYKWQNARAGGWMAGKIVAQRSDESPYHKESKSDLENGRNEGDNFFCEWQDGAELSVPLTLDALLDPIPRFEDLDYAIGTWLLLTLPSDDHVAQLAAQGLLNNPTGKPTSSGRKSHVRLKPAAGPTGLAGPKRKRRQEK